MQQDLFVKICGITNLEDAMHAVRCKADAVGFVFYERSERYVAPERAAEIVAQLPDFVSKVGVFVNATQRSVEEIARKVNLSAVQLYGKEGPDDLVGYEASVIKAFNIRPNFDVEVMRNYLVDAFLLDAHSEARYGGSGKTFDWNIAVRAKEYGRIILAGGLTPENIEDAVRFVQPYGVDVSSGVEGKPGKKDPERVRNFIARAKDIPLSYNMIGEDFG
ncbi:MAG: phosphoribosylanthranilate isomerase [Ignavibacteriales bacterium]|nr:phosphoribosylanthranilate isomerase [Ignavibacteriales bacterium]